MTVRSNAARCEIRVPDLGGTVAVPDPVIRAGQRALDRAWLHDDPDAYRAGVAQVLRELARTGAQANAPAGRPRPDAVRRTG